MDTWLIFHDFIASDGGTENIIPHALLDLTLVLVERIFRKIRISHTLESATTGALGFQKGEE